MIRAEAEPIQVILRVRKRGQEPLTRVRPDTGDQESRRLARDCLDEDALKRFIVALVIKDADPCVGGIDRVRNDPALLNSNVATHVPTLGESKAEDHPFGS